MPKKTSSEKVERAKKTFDAEVAGQERKGNPPKGGKRRSAWGKEIDAQNKLRELEAAIESGKLDNELGI